ncbi:MAG: DnaA regulatory inactivator Hda, partial [Alphaproteobacteria bacterium]|nr:DnaA regulatory inactivator Hda [Alphaproteobacteria bacterium]
LKHIERSFGAVNAWVNKLDRYAAVHHRTITIPLIRELLYGNSL